MREEDFPTEQPEAEQDPRLSGSHADARRAGADWSSSPQGTLPPFRLIWRVRDRATFRALSAGRRHFRGALMMTCVRSAESGPARVAYAIPKSVGNSVARNRVRRRLRALVHARAAQLRPGHAYLIGAASGANTATFGELDRSFGALLEVTGHSQ
jgi:ribonuclease P protein component